MGKTGFGNASALPALHNTWFMIPPVFIDADTCPWKFDFCKKFTGFITAILSLLNLNESYDPIHHPADVNRNITAFPEDFGLSSGLEEHQVTLCLQLKRILLAATGCLMGTLQAGIWGLYFQLTWSRIGSSELVWSGWFLSSCLQLFGGVG